MSSLDLLFLTLANLLLPNTRNLWYSRTLFVNCWHGLTPPRFRGKLFHMLAAWVITTLQKTSWIAFLVFDPLVLGKLHAALDAKFSSVI